MEQDEKIEPDYVQGFNEGYAISQHMPELAEKLANIDSDYIRLEGFKAGREQYQTEQVRERLPAWLTGDRSAKDTTAPDKTIGREIEPDRD